MSCQSLFPILIAFRFYFNFVVFIFIFIILLRAKVCFVLIPHLLISLLFLFSSFYYYYQSFIGSNLGPIWVQFHFFCRPNSDLKSGPTQQPSQVQLDWPFSRVHVGSLPCVCIQIQPMTHLRLRGFFSSTWARPCMPIFFPPMLEHTKGDNPTHLLSTFPAPSSHPCTTYGPGS